MSPFLRSAEILGEALQDRKCDGKTAYFRVADRDPPRDKSDMSLFQLPLIRLLAVNLLIGIGSGALMLVGLVALNPQLRALIMGDPFGMTAAGVLLFGLIVTFGSVAMGTAVMALGRKPPEDGGQRGKAQPAPARARA